MAMKKLSAKLIVTNDYLILRNFSKLSSYEEIYLFFNEYK